MLRTQLAHEEVLPRQEEEEDKETREEIRNEELEEEKMALDSL